MLYLDSVLVFLVRDNIFLISCSNLNQIIFAGPITNRHHILLPSNIGVCHHQNVPHPELSEKVFYCYREFVVHLLPSKPLRAFA